METTEEENVLLPSQLAQFGPFDYTVFSAMLAASALIGVYFGFFARRDNTTSEYLMGGKNMGIFPVSMSLISRYCVYSIPQHFFLPRVMSKTRLQNQ
jgi:hypothetical protein